MKNDILKEKKEYIVSVRNIMCEKWIPLELFETKAEAASFIVEQHKEERNPYLRYRIVERISMERVLFEQKVPHCG